MIPFLTSLPFSGCYLNLTLPHFRKNNKEKNQNKPVQVLLTPKYLRLTGKILTALSPLLASRFAARLFLTPYKYKLPKREQQMDRESLQQKLNVPAINREIVVYKYGEGNKKILMVHGWNGRGTQLSVLAQAFKELGFQIITFDAPAHGKAPGKISMMPFFIESIHELNRQFGPFETAVGHSLGGMSLLRAVKEGFNIRKLVIIGTANSITHITKMFAMNLGLNSKVAAKMKNYFDEKFGEDMDNYSGAFSAEEVNIPTLVIHDKDDIDVDVSSAYEIDQSLEDGKLFITEGLGHRKILGDPKAINKITRFIAV